MPRSKISSGVRGATVEYEEVNDEEGLGKGTSTAPVGSPKEETEAIVSKLEVDKVRIREGRTGENDSEYGEPGGGGSARSGEAGAEESAGRGEEQQLMREVERVPGRLRKDSVTTGEG